MTDERKEAKAYIGDVSSLETLVDRVIDGRKRFALEFVGESAETGEPRWMLEHDDLGVSYSEDLQSLLKDAATDLETLERIDEEE